MQPGESSLLWSVVLFVPVSRALFMHGGKGVPRQNSQRGVHGAHVVQLPHLGWTRKD